MTVTITRKIPDAWCWDALTDAKIVEEIYEDPMAIFDGAEWQIERDSPAGIYE